MNYDVMIIKLVSNEEIIGKVVYNHNVFDVISPLLLEVVMVNKSEGSQVMKPWICDQFIREEEPSCLIEEYNTISTIPASKLLTQQYHQFVKEMRDEARARYPHPVYH